MRFSIWFSTKFDGVGRDDSTYTSFGSAKVLMTVTFPISVNFLCCHYFKQVSKFLIFESKFNFKLCSLLVEKNIPRAFATVELHWNFFFSKYVIFVFLVAPIRNTWHLFAFNFNPDTHLKFSKTSIKVSKDCLEPSRMYLSIHSLLLLFLLCSY